MARAYFSNRRTNQMPKNENTVLAKLEAQRSALADKLAAARAAAEQAMSARRSFLLSGAIDDVKSRAQVDRRVIDCQSAEVGIEDALEQIDLQIESAKATLDLERDKAKRDAYAKALRAKADALAEKTAQYQNVGEELLALVEAIDALPHSNPDFKIRMRTLVTELPLAAVQFVEEARQNAAGVEVGRLPIPGTPQPVKATAPAPHVEHRDVFLMQDSKWPLHGETRTGAKYSTASVPVAIANKGIAKGLAYELASPVVAKLKELHGDRRVMVHAMECTDLETGSKVYDGPTIDGSPPPVIGKPVTGTIGVQRQW
jgi:predicted  nucleic acid-binding Zn-ribbon protein